MDRGGQGQAPGRQRRLVTDEHRFRTDLYAGTAEDYDRFRLPYPTALLDDLCTRAGIGASARVLDLGCGTGQIAFAVAPRVGSVLAIDQEPESVELGHAKAARLGVDSIQWMVGAAETVELDGAFDLVMVGNAFHRFDRARVAHRLVPHLTDDGAVALLWGGTPWPGGQPWQFVLQETVEHWQGVVGAHGRIPPGWEAAMRRRPHKQVLQRAGLRYEGKREFPVSVRWTVESLVGWVFSTSILNRVALGDRADEFAADLRDRLLVLRPDDEFAQELTFAYELARRPK